MIRRASSFRTNGRNQGPQTGNRSTVTSQLSVTQNRDICGSECMRIGLETTAVISPCRVNHSSN